MPSRVISPPVEAFDQLRTPLTAGERAVFEMFHRKLPPEWEIYVQPHLNGMKPDLVLLNPWVGIAVFEIKDWDFDAVTFRVVDGTDEGPLLYGETKRQRRVYRSRNPIEQVERYKKAIYNIYCPRLKERSGLSAITAGVIFTRTDARRARTLLMPFLEKHGKRKPYLTVTGEGDLRDGRIQDILPAVAFSSSRHMTPDIADDLRGWLTEPDFSSERRTPLLMDRNQRNLVDNWPASGFRRVKGPAGSGKSMVLAARAAKLANEGKDVLIVTFNITLMHYLRDLVMRDYTGPQAHRHITYKHFHGWCKDVCEEADMGFQYKEMTRGFLSKPSAVQESIMKEEMPTLAALAIKENGHMLDHYDAILVDEGQDFLPLWLRVVQGVLRPGGQMLLVADATQDVYGTATTHTDDAMRSVKFSGPWAQLRTGYRLPALLQHQVRDFAEIFFKGRVVDLAEPAQGELNVAACGLQWLTCSRHDAVQACEKAILDLMLLTGQGGLSNVDITFLTDESWVGSAVLQLLSAKGIETMSALDETYRVRRREKLTFYVARSRIRATTLHSFKGWESRLLVLYLSRSDTPERLATIYAGLTRLKENPGGSHLTVVCSDEKLSDYGRRWKEIQPSLLRQDAQSA